MAEKLFTPGPVAVPTEALEAEARPLIHHRTPEFQKELALAFEGLRDIYQTQDPVMILACSGTGAMESAVANLVSPGDAVLVVRGGKFADRWMNIARAYGADVTGLDVEWGHAADPAALEAALKARKYSVVFATHSETSTGARHDVKALAALCRAHGPVFVVDGITSLGAMELRTAEWGIDVVIGGSQKGFMIAPGLGFVSVSARARELAAKCRSPRFYFDWARSLKGLEANDTPFTPAISLVRALVATLTLMRAEGVQALWERHARNGAAARAAMRAMGLEIYPRVPSEALTTVVSPAGLASGTLIKAVRQRHGMRMANGQDAIKDKVIRIGHLGFYGQADILGVVGAIEDSLASLGHPVTPGAGLTAAQQVYAGKPETAARP